VLRGDVGDRAAAGQGGYPVREQVPLGDEDARRARATGELVRGEEDGVLVSQPPVLALRGGVHVDREVRSRGGVIPAGKRAVAVEQDGDRVHVGDDAGDIRRRREAPDLEPARGVALELCLEPA
jgi:hypothetical protein